MKEKEQVEEWLHRYRGIGLAALCVLMFAAAYPRMDKEVVETGSGDVANTLSVTETPAEEWETSFCGMFAGKNVNVPKIWDIMGKYHARGRMELCGEEDGIPVKWQVEYQR